MNQFDVIQGFRERAETDSPPPDRLAAECLKAVEALGFRYFACCSPVDPFHPPREAVMLHNYPRGWVRTFSEARLYEIDPVLQLARSSPSPFFWDTALRSDSLTREQRIVLAEAAGYGLVHGYTIPLHSSWRPGTLRASCSVIPDSGSIDIQNYLAMEVLAEHFYFFSTRAHAPPADGSSVELTLRERQCLALVAQGKDDWTIGLLLGTGASTAHYHIEQAKRRLGVATRVQAVAKALMIGQLTFEEIDGRAPVSCARPDCAPRAQAR